LSATAPVQRAARIAKSEPSIPATIGVKLWDTTIPFLELRVTRDDYRHIRRLNNSRADRAEQHSGEPATTMAADDNQLG
jgi:hypothetical protein